jgi:hypothetical protein
MYVEGPLWEGKKCTWNVTFDARSRNSSFCGKAVHASTVLRGPEESKGMALIFLYPWGQKRVGGQRHVLAALSLGKRPGTNCTGGSVVPSAGLDGC